LILRQRHYYLAHLIRQKKRVHAWFDDKDRREDETVATGVAMLKAGGRFSAEKPKELWARWTQEHVSGEGRGVGILQIQDVIGITLTVHLYY